MAGIGQAERPSILGDGDLIFVTVGALFPFDRLVRAMDALAWGFQEGAFFAQIGAGKYQPTHMKFSRLLDAAAFREAIETSRVVVAHAGMGSVISALEANRPVVVMPRKADHGEHTTDHQAATAKWLEGRPGVHVAWDETELADAIRAAQRVDLDRPVLPPTAPEPFLEKIRQYISNA